MSDRVVYVLANDTVADWLIALLNSIRKNLPGAVLRVIPFDGRIGRISSFTGEYGFTIFEHESFSWLGEIGRRLELGRTPVGPNWFRRFAAFFGPEGTFFYVDARTLVLSDLSPGFESVNLGEVDLVHFGGDPNQVFENGPARTGFAAAGRCFGFNSGRWISRSGAFSREEMEAAADFCVANRSQMNPRNTDQFFLNVLCSRSTARVVNLADLDGRFERDPWAFAHGQVFDRDGDVRVWAHGAMSHGRTLPLVHWAGIGLSSSMPLRRLWNEYRHDGILPLRVRLEGFTSLPARIGNRARRSMFARRFISPRNAGLK